jgi:hypothetical protein
MIMYGVRQIRVTPLLLTGAPDGSASPIVSTKIQTLDISPAYIDGSVATLRGGDKVVAEIQEEDVFKGVNITINMATAEAKLKAAMVGGTESDGKWSAPKDATEMPYPFKLEVWQANYTESEESIQDGFIKHEFDFCKRGRLGGKSITQQEFSTEQYTFEARRNTSNPTDIKPAWDHEKVASIV